MKNIFLTKGQVAIVDDEDYEYLMQWKWYAKPDKNTFYAATDFNKPKCRTIRMHRILMGMIGNQQVVDHINHNGLDNRKYNLRVCTNAENCANQLKSKNKKTSKYIGVSYRKDSKKWRAYTKKDRKPYFFGSYNTEIEAAIAYNNYVISVHGEFASLNIIQP